MSNSRITKILELLELNSKSMIRPMTESIVYEFGHKPFLVLVACLLSLRSRDSITLLSARKIFSLAQTPEELLSIPLFELEQMVKPVNYYKRKSKILHAVSTYLIQHHSGIVPSNREALLAIKGVGLKTANLVLSEAFDIPALCVDTHVHRISNRLGLVKTKKPEETEKELSKIIPPRYWKELNRLFVMWGQNICRPLSPHCSQCPLSKTLCPKIKVVRQR